MKLITLLQIAGLLHFTLLWAGATMPRAVNLRHHLTSLPPFIRNLFWVYYTFIGLMLLSFGTITLLCAQELASGTLLARAFCVLLTVFWTIRLFAALFVFDVRPYLTNWFYRLGYRAINVVFTVLPIIYGWAAWKGGAL